MATKKDFGGVTGLKWFYRELQRSANDFSYNAFSIRTSPFIGGMFFFIYDAKHKETLPYWDKFPLVIPIEMYNDGFLGLNLHYLPPFERLLLLNRLRVFKTGSQTVQQYMKISYALLKQYAKTKAYIPTIHRYLTSHLRSRLVQVNSDDWHKVVELPVQKFVGKQPY